MIGLLDYGAGNLRSISAALEHIGQVYEVVDSSASVLESDLLIIPGVGSFPRAMRRLKLNGIVESLKERASTNRPILGVCLGMQLLFDSSEEHGGSQGLGLIPGRVLPIQDSQRRLNPVGWRRVQILGAKEEETLPLFFAHSFRAEVSDRRNVTATYLLDGAEIVAAVEHSSIVGFQFHPEKSGEAGIAMFDQSISRLLGIGRGHE